MQKISSGGLQFPFLNVVNAHFKMSRQLTSSLTRGFFVTVYDKESKVSGIGMMYLSQTETVIYLDRFAGESSVLLKLEPTDDVQYRSGSFADFMTIEEENREGTPTLSGPLNYFSINDRYILITDMQLFLSPFKLAGANVRLLNGAFILNGNDEREEHQNLLAAIKASQSGTQQTVGRMTGMSPAYLRFNAYIQLTILLGAAGLILFGALFLILV